MTKPYFHSLQYPHAYRRGCAAPIVVLLVHGKPGNGKDSAARATVNHAHELSEALGRKFTIFTPTGGEKESVEAETDARMIFAPLLVLLLEPTEGDATAHNAFPCRECQPAGGANVAVGCCS